MDIAILGRNDHQRVVGERLRRLIDELGLTYVEASEVMGITKHVLRNWMAGDSYPNPYALYRLCRSRNVDFNFVFLGDWSSLPARIGKRFEDELSQALDGQPEGHPMDAEKT
jgi:transcriptional regulator with XRE-family HTH domain